MRRVFLIATVVLIGASACSDDDTTEADPEPGPPASLNEVPTTEGHVEVVIDGATYTAELTGCSIDPESASVEFLALGNRDGIPFRIEYGEATANQLGLVINPTGPLDDGDQRFIGSPRFELTETTAVAREILMTEVGTDREHRANARLECRSE